jgi:hypothetical protein
MRSRLVGWEDVWAFLAIAVGLITATNCLADDPYPDSTNVLPPGTCYAQTGSCFKPWDTQCWNQGGQITDDMFACPAPGGTVWVSLQQVQFRPYGYCRDSGTVSCYSDFYCAEYAIYNLSCLNPNRVEKCRRWITANPGCATP